MSRRAGPMRPATLPESSTASFCRNTRGVQQRACECKSYRRCIELQLGSRCHKAAQRVRSDGDVRHIRRDMNSPLPAGR